MSATFLKAEWRKLAMANYAIDPGVLEAYLPYRTELDYWNGTCYVSLVGFMFLDTRIRGLRIPFHVNFGEINLRFYVKYAEQGVWKRGVVFVKEIVPRRALSLVVNVLYKEKYEIMPVRHLWQSQDEHWDITYKWGKGLGNALKVTAGKDPEPVKEGSKEALLQNITGDIPRLQAGKQRNMRWLIHVGRCTR